jgi:short-subunit dehydrogenase
MNQGREFGHVLITGASSGIGAALARHYASPGRTLSLHGRDPTRLAAVAAVAEASGAEVATGLGDVRDREPLAAWVDERDRVRAIDLVIANAGISGRPADETIAVNVMGVINTIEAVLPAMRARRRGTIAIISSLAAWRGLPTAPAYGASKAAVRLWGEGLRGRLRPFDVRVCVVCPGFVATPLVAANRFPMPFVMDADRAARRIARGLARGRARIAFPLRLYALVRMIAALPPAWTDPILARFTAKE